MIEAMKQKMIQFCPNKLENEASWFGHLDLKTKHDCQERLNVTDKFPKWQHSGPIFQVFGVTCWCSSPLILPSTFLCLRNILYFRFVLVIFDGPTSALSIWKTRAWWWWCKSPGQPRSRFWIHLSKSITWSIHDGYNNRWW